MNEFIQFAVDAHKLIGLGVECFACAFIHFLSVAHRSGTFTTNKAYLSHYDRPVV